MSSGFRIPVRYSYGTLEVILGSAIERSYVVRTGRSSDPRICNVFGLFWRRITLPTVILAQNNSPSAYPATERSKQTPASDRSGARITGPKAQRAIERAPCSSMVRMFPRTGCQPDCRESLSIPRPAPGGTSSNSLETARGRLLMGLPFCLPLAGQPGRQAGPAVARSSASICQVL